MSKNLGKKKGFSLVELIVVIAIIGILAAVAVPKYAKYQENARYKADVASGKIIAQAGEAYIVDSGIQTLSETNITATEPSEIVDYLNKVPVTPQSNGYTKFTISITDGKVVVNMDSTNKVIELYPNPTVKP